MESTYTLPSLETSRTTGPSARGSSYAYTTWVLNTAVFYFCNNFVTPSSILIILALIYLSKCFLSQAYFTFFIKSKAENQLKFQQHSAPAQRVHTACNLPRRETPDFITAPNLRISDFIPVDYRILAMLLEWIHQRPMWDTDKLRQRLIDRQTIIDQAIDRWWFGLRAWVMARGGHFWTPDTVQCFTTALRCWSIRFRTLYDVSVGDDNDCNNDDV